MKTNWFANIFIWVNDVIEAADRPISQVVMVLLPFIAPILPAMITAKSLREYMNLPKEWTWIGVVAFEFVGYLGMISLVGALMAWIKDEKNHRSWTNVLVTGTAYTFYLLSLIVTNLILELENDVPVSHVTVTACLTVGLSVASSLLNAQRIFDRNTEDKEEKRREKDRQERLEKYRIKYGNNEKVAGKLLESRESVEKVSSNLPTDWRKIRPKLTPEQVSFIAQSEPKTIVETLSKSGLNISPRTASNWHTYAMEEKGLKLK